MKTLGVPRRARYQRRPARWAAYAAPRIGMEPQSAEALVHGRFPIHRRFAGLVEAAVALDDRRLLDKLMGPVDGALAGLRDEALTPALICAVQEADMAEDGAEARFLANPTPEHKRQFAAAVRHQRATSLRLLLALEAE